MKFFWKRKKSLFYKKKSLLTYLDKILKIIIISKKFIFNFLVEVEKKIVSKKNKSIFNFFSYIKKKFNFIITFFQKLK